MSKVAFIIITYNGAKYIEKCIDSIKTYCPNSYIIVIDNNSHDGTPEILKKLPIDDLSLCDVNYGFGKGNNIGFRKALQLDFDTVFLANQDIYFHKGDFDTFLRQSLLAFREEKFGIISPIHFAPNERDYDRKFTEYISEKNTPNLLQHLEANTPLEEVYPSKAINAAAWLVSKECIEKVGIFDPIFPHYGEDTDYIRRMRYHGFKIGVCPLVSLVHDRDQEPKTDLKKQYYGIKMWSLVYAKDINNSLGFMITRFPFELRNRIKKLAISPTQKVVVFLKITTFLKLKSVLLLRHRAKSKKNGAFIS